MPRLDVPRVPGHGYRSGFWGIAKSARRRLELSLPADSSGGGRDSRALAHDRARRPPADGGPGAGPARRAAGRDLHGDLRAAARPVRAPARVDPRPDPRQLDLRDQRRLLAARSGSPRSRPPSAATRGSSCRARRGAWASTATSSGRWRSRRPTRGTWRSPTRTTRWHPDKLATLLRRARRRAARLQRRPGRRPRRRADRRHLLEHARNNHTDLLSLLVANAVTGAASLFRARAARRRAPVPAARQFAHFHDHWLALVALALGEIAFVDRPLYDYVQHGDATLGHAAANRDDRAARPTRRAAARPARARPNVAHALLRRRLPAACSSRPCCGCAAAARMRPAKRRVLERFLAADRSLAGAGALGARGARELLGGARDARRRMDAVSRLRVAARCWPPPRRERPQRRLRLDAVPPPTLDPRPGPPRPRGPPRAIAEKIAPLELGVRDDAPRARQPADPDDRPRALLRRLHREVQPRAPAGAARRCGCGSSPSTRSPPLPRDWRQRIEAYSGLGGAVRRGRGRVRPGAARPRGQPRPTASLRPPGGRRTSPTAPRRARRRALPLPDPGVRAVHVPDGHLRRAGRGVVPFPACRAVLDRAVARVLPRHGLGVYARREAGDARSASFQNAITRSSRRPAAELAGAARRAPALLRPARAARGAQHVRARRARARRARSSGACSPRLELRGIGAVERPRRIDLGGGARLDLLRRAASAPTRGCCASTTSAWR